MPSRKGNALPPGAWRILSRKRLTAAEASPPAGKGSRQWNLTGAGVAYRNVWPHLSWLCGFTLPTGALVTHVGANTCPGFGARPDGPRRLPRPCERPLPAWPGPPCPWPRCRPLRPGHSTSTQFLPRSRKLHWQCGPQQICDAARIGVANGTPWKDAVADNPPPISALCWPTCS